MIIFNISKSLKLFWNKMSDISYSRLSFKKLKLTDCTGVLESHKKVPFVLSLQTN